MAKTPRMATPAPAPGPAPSARPQPTAVASAPRGSWSRRALGIFLLICLAGVIPVMLTGELLGWWRLSRSAPYLVPLHVPWSSEAAPSADSPGIWMTVEKQE